MTQDEAIERFSRGVAVLLVDTAHQYTAEFAPSPAQHVEEYDNLQSAIQFVLTSGDLDELDLEVLRRAISIPETVSEDGSQPSQPAHGEARTGEASQRPNTQQETR